MIQIALFFTTSLSKDDRIIHGDEMYKGLYKEIIPLYKEEHPSSNSTRSLEFNEEHFLLLKKPIKSSNKHSGILF